MTRFLSFLAVLALLTPAAAGADGPAVTLYGGKMTSLKSDGVNNKAHVVLELNVERDVTLTVRSRDGDVFKPLADGLQKRTKEFPKRSKEIEKQYEEAARKGDEKLAKELKDQLLKAADDAVFAPAVAAGTLSFKDGAWQLVGSLRLIDPEKTDKGVARGSCVIEGEMMKGEFTAGDVTSKLAVRAGGLTVLLRDVDAKDVMKGKVRATGRLILTEDGGAILDATAVEAVKK